MRLSTHVVVLSSLVALVSAAVAGPIKPGYVAASARWVVHVDLDLLKKAEVGKVALAELNTADANRKLAALQAIFNFDPRKDLADVTVYGQDNKPDGSVAILEGTFDAERMITLLTASDSYRSSRHGDTVIHSWIDQNNPRQTRTYGAVAPGGAVAIGQGEAAIGNAIDVLTGRAPSMAKAGALNGVDFQGAAFLRLAADVSAMNLAGTPAATFGQQTRAVQASLSETDGGLNAKLMVEKETPELAAQLEQIARGLIAMSAMQNQQTTPEAAKLAQNIKIAVQGKTVTLALRIASADAIDFLRGQIAKGEARAARTATPPARPATGQ